MERDSRPKGAVEPRQILEAQLRECFGRVVYSHKSHEKCADILLCQWSRIKVAQIVLSAITAGGFIAAVFGAGLGGALVGVVVSTTLLAINAFPKNYDWGELAQKHKQTARDLWLIRERYLSLITDLSIGKKPLEVLQGERDELLQALHAVYSGAPATTNRAYVKAQEALKTKEDMTFSEDEIDAFLPKELKRSNRGERQDPQA